MWELIPIIFGLYVKLVGFTFICTFFNYLRLHAIFMFASYSIYILTYQDAKAVKMTELP